MLQYLLHLKVFLLAEENVIFKRLD